MRLSLENVGKIQKADIALNGITVIAGENNTGKSTVGKVLFCLFNALYKLDEQIYEERNKAICNIINRELYHSHFLRPSHTGTLICAKAIVKNINDYRENSSALSSKLQDLANGSDGNPDGDISAEQIANATEKIAELINITDDEIVETLLKKRFRAEFGMQLGNLNNRQAATQIALDIKGKLTQITIKDGEMMQIVNPISFYSDLIYLDDPFVVDDLNTMSLFYAYHHRDHLKAKIMQARTDSEQNAVEEIITQKKLDSIYEKLGLVCSGELVKQDGGELTYQSTKFKETLNVVNLSTGIKTFVIIRALLMNGSLTENGTIVLDEPEIHLHPEWQLIFAEIIVLIQKEFHMNILLNTHSPYFLSAIEVYSQKYSIQDKCKYYLSVNEGDYAEITDVSDNTELIYSKLAKPLQDLENERYR